MRPLRSCSFVVLLALLCPGVSMTYAQSHRVSVPRHIAEGDSVLEVDVAADPQSGPAVLTVSLSAQASGGTGQGYTYFWDFDGSDGIQVDAIGSSITYPFGFPGEHVVTVKAWDDNGNWGSGTVKINVSSANLTPSDPIVLKDVSFPSDSPYVIEGLDFTAEDDMHIYLENVENVVIRGNRFRNLRIKESIGAINVMNSSGILIEGNLIEDCYKGMYIVGSENVQICRNVLKNIGYENEETSGDGIIVTGPSTHVLIEGNFIGGIGPTYDVPPPGLDVPGAYIPIVSIGIGTWGVSDCTVRGNFVFDVHGVNIIAQDPPPTLAEVPTQLTVEGNFVRNQLIREAGIMINDYPDVKINRNLVDYSNNIGISVSDCENVEIGDNIVLNCVGSGIDIIDSRRMKVHHNTLIRDAFGEGLPSGESGVGIYVRERRIDPYPYGEPPFVSSEILIADNLVDGWYQGAIFLGSGDRNYVDWNAVVEVDLKNYNRNMNSYIRIIDLAGTTVIGGNNRVGIPQYIARDEKNYFLLSSDPLSSAGHDGAPAGAIWDESYVFDLDTSDVKPSTVGGNILRNGGAEDGVLHPWGVGGGAYNMSDILFEVRSTAEIGGRSVGPYSGSRFFFVRGTPKPGEGGSIEIVYPFQNLDAGLSEEIDEGSCFFKLTFHVLTSDIVPDDTTGIQGDYGFDIRAVFYDAQGEEGYLCSSANLCNWESADGYRRFTIYGQIPPGSRQVSVDISFRPFEDTPKVAAAFDDVSLEILTGVPVGIDEAEIATPRKFILYQNYPNPFNSGTIISYELPEAAQVAVKVYNVLGQEVATLLETFQPAGRHSVVWNPGGVSSGIYFYRIVTDKLADTKKCLLLK